jgi:hypothetical protein
MHWKCNDFTKSIKKLFIVHKKNELFNALLVFTLVFNVRFAG